MLSDPLGAVIAPVTAVLEQLDVLYYIGGSVASMTHGEYRQTADVDIVAQMQSRHIAAFVRALENDFYVDEPMIRDAVRVGGSFNVMHLDTMFKVDVFALKDRPYDRQAAQRRQRHSVETQPSVEAYIAAPEDILIAKLEWFRLGGETSERQWRDILGICKIQLFDLDFDYLHRWSRELKIHDLLEKALDEAGISDTNKNTGIEL